MTSALDKMIKWSAPIIPALDDEDRFKAQDIETMNRPSVSSVDQSQEYVSPDTHSDKYFLKHTGANLVNELFFLLPSE